MCDSDNMEYSDDDDLDDPMDYYGKNSTRVLEVLAGC